MNQRLRPWDAITRPVACRDFALAMYRAGQDRIEVKRRLHAMDRWAYDTVADALWWAEGELGLSFRYCPPETWKRSWRRS